MSRWVVLVVALASCRAVFGIDDPSPPKDASVLESPGLLMHVLPNKSLWTSRQTVDDAWNLITPLLEVGTQLVPWYGEDPTASVLLQDGIPDATQPFTIWFEGAILVESNTLTLALSADDYAFIDFARDGANFTRMTDAMTADSGIQTLTNLSAHVWYPIRMGWTQTFGSATFEVRTFDANNAPVSLGVDRLRYAAGSGAGTGS